MQPAFLPLPVFALFALAVIVVVLLIVLQWLHERKRARELQGFAEKNGWGYIDKDPHDRPHRYRHFTPFGQGHSRYAHNILRTTMYDAPVEVFDYHYAITTHTGKSSNTQHYHHKVCTMQMPLSAPDLTIKREHLGHKILNAVGEFEIDFESDEFSRRYWVRCKDRRFAYDVIDARTMEFLLEHQGWHWQWRGHTLMVFKRGKLRPPMIHKMSRLVHGFHQRLPRHLVAQVAVPSDPSR